MKAITCPQCGATIDEVSENSVIIHCDYCGVRIMLDDVPAKPAPAKAEAPAFYKEEPTTMPLPRLMAIICAAVVAVPTLVGVLLFGKQNASRPGPVYSAAATPAATTPTPITFTVGPTKPTPVINYQPRVSWDGPNDMQSFDDPDVDISSVSDLTADEIKKTVFKDRTVKLRVVINTEGEIDSVEKISGHPLLVEAATRSARRTIFRSRVKPSTRILTYTFRLLPD